MMVQLAKPIGAGLVVHPTLAAWLPNIIFGSAGVVLFARART
jgi:lipopolysaccharide export LptBFGC system permease protein LptF